MHSKESPIAPREPWMDQPHLVQKAQDKQSPPIPKEATLNGSPSVHAPVMEYSGGLIRAPTGP